MDTPAEHVAVSGNSPAIGISPEPGGVGSHDLNGQWRAAISDADLRRAVAEPGFTDHHWASIRVPGHWRSTPAFAHTDGPLLYRRSFTHEALNPGERAWLCLDGVFYQADLWLDGAYIGDTEGYFVPQELEITDALAQTDEHWLTVEAACSAAGDRTAKRNITGVFQHSDYLDPQWNPGGIWRDVRVERSGSVRIRRLRVVCREATDTRAVLAIRVELDSADAQTVRIETRVGDLTEQSEEHHLAKGHNRVAWTVNVDQPPLWWPWALGEQPLIDVDVLVSVNDRCSHALRRRVGLRSVVLRNWICSINGERLFLKGANQGPARMELADASANDLIRDVHLARDAGLDFLRVHGHITRPEFYDAADEAGLLLWQDMPLQWGYARSVRKEAQRQAGWAVDVLGHHPSIFVWCGHNEPFRIEGRPVRSRRLIRRIGATRQLPSWNRTVLDTTVRRALSKADDSRPVIAHSGVPPHLPQLDGSDSHLYFGWYHGDERDLAGFCRAMPRMARFVGEFGAQAVPGTLDFMEPAKWPDLDWQRLSERHGLQKDIFDERVPPEGYPTLDAWQRATQHYQAELIQRQVETLRRLKYRPTGGFAQFCFADAHPAVSWSVLGHDRVAKLGYQALMEACRPVIVVADRLPAIVTAGATFALDVHVVSDLRQGLEEVAVNGRLQWSHGQQTWAWRGDIAADSCARVGTISFVVPDSPGPLYLSLDLLGGDVAVSNRYEAVIISS